MWIVMEVVAMATDLAQVPRRGTRSLLIVSRVDGNQIGTWTGSPDLLIPAILMVDLHPFVVLLLAYFASDR